MAYMLRKHGTIVQIGAKGVYSFCLAFFFGPRLLKTFVKKRLLNNVCYFVKTFVILDRPTTAAPTS